MPVTFTDHVGCVRVIFYLNPSKKVGKSYWKLSVSFLDDEEIYEPFTDLWQHIVSRQCKHNNLLEWWEEVKRKIKFVFIHKGVEKNW